MELPQFEDHLRRLATVEESDSPLVTCYLDLSNGVSGVRREIACDVQSLRNSLPSASAGQFDKAVERIEAYLNEAVWPRTRGLAAFSRAGSAPFWMALQFEVPLPTWITAGPAPDIYHLLELKDNYDRYMILLINETTARILSVSLGSVTAQLWNSRPELRRRTGHEWNREHLSRHRRERVRQFVHDEVRRLDRLVAAAGCAHLVLAGNPRMLSAVRRALPKRLAERLADSVPAGPADRVSDIVAATLQAFLEHEEQDSQALSERLITQIRTHGRAVAGTRATMDALRAGQSALLVVVKGYDPGRGWECRGCGKLELELPKPNNCPGCRSTRLREFDIRGELARLAQQQDVHVEVVDHNDALMGLGGVGCLLRYFAPANYAASAA